MEKLVILTEVPVSEKIVALDIFPLEIEPNNVEKLLTYKVDIFVTFVVKELMYKVEMLVPLNVAPV